MSWLCYILRCADGTFYCGITNDMDKRLAVHNAGEGAKYTRGRTPVRLAYHESCADKSTALKREMEIKRLPRAKKLALVEGAQKTFPPGLLPRGSCNSAEKVVLFNKFNKEK